MNETKHNQNTHRASGEQVRLGKAIMRVLIGRKHESDAQKAGNKQKTYKIKKRNQHEEMKTTR